MALGVLQEGVTEGAELLTGNVTSRNETQPWSDFKLSLVVLLSCCSTITTLGNLFVIVAFCIEKRLRTNFNIFLFNLAITDLLVSVTAMPLYAVDYAYGYWPFDVYTCGLWVFVDWGMTFASIFTLVAISIDRYWAACWSTNYRANNTRKRMYIIITVIWCSTLVVWVPPFGLDRYRWSKEGECVWEIGKNRVFSVFVALLGYHGPSILMIVCYIKVVITMWRIRKNLAKKQNQGLTPSKVVAQPETSDTSDTSSRMRSYSGSTSYANANNVIRLHPDPSSDALSSVSGAVEPSAKRIRRVHTKKRVGLSRKEKKIFASLSCVVIAYLICWTPWHVVFDLRYFFPDQVSGDWYTFAAMMCYMNSAVNPILYTCANKDFRKAFRRILTCGLCKR